MTAVKQRSLSAVDCEMRTLLTLNAEAQQRIDSVNDDIRRATEYRDGLELEIEARRAKFDALLDERIALREQEMEINV